MGFIKETMAYLKRVFWVAVLIALVPSIVFAFFLKPANTLAFLPEYYSGSIDGFSEIFLIILGAEKWKDLFVFPLLMIFALVYFSISLAVIEKHMRTGRLTARRLLSDLNNTIIPTVISLLFFAVIFTLGLTLLSSLLTLMHRLVSDRGAPTLIDCVYASLLAFGMLALLVRVVVDVVFWGPVTQVYGYSFKDAIIETSHITNKNTFAIFFGLLWPHIVAAGIVIGVYYIPLSGAVKTAITIISNTAVYLFLFLYIPAFIMNTLFGITELERRDKTKLF